MAANTSVAAVSSVPGGISLFIVDRDGAVQSTFFDPRVAQPHWSDWFRIGDAGRVAPNTMVAAVSSVPGGISLFVADRGDAVQGTFFDPRVAQPRWVDWFRLSEPDRVGRGTSIAAVSTVPAGVSLFLVDPAGAVGSAFFDPRQAE